MEIAMIVLLSASVILFILSFFQKDPVKEIEKQVENTSISLMQEILKLKQKISVLEEELMIPENDQEMKQKKG